MAGLADLDGKITAAFAVEFDLPIPPAFPLEDASAAIKHEYRASVRKKRLRCLGWEKVPGREEGSIYALKVGRTVEFDWSWEGAVAYRPGASTGDPSDDVAIEEAGEAEMCWRGEVVEVDQTSGRIFVSIADPDQEPTTGTFYVSPFEFLGLLNEVYNARSFADVRALLPPRLGAAGGGIHPRLDAPVGRGLPALRPMWDHAWGILWEPPGTGKTYSIGRQVAACLDDATERILVVSTTNKAVDGAAIQVGKACRSLPAPACSPGRILRVGKGVHLKSFHDEGLDDLVRGAEGDRLREVARLKQPRSAEKLPESRAALLVEINQILKRVGDISRHAFMAGDVDVVVATAFRASTMLWYPEYREMIEQGLAPFTTIIIDEAGLISRAATAVLSLLASRRVVLAGDPKQLAPISRMSRVLPTSQARWLASSGLNHLHDVRQHAGGLHLLRTQYRMRPEIGEVVSRYQYGGELETADEVKDRPFDPPRLLAVLPRAIWYVLDDDKGDHPQIRAERGPGNRSWVRRKTRDVLEKLFSDPQVRTSKGLFISPLVAQAKSIATFFADEGHASWSSSTVHSQQGAEADIVIFDTVNASSTSWPIHEWLRLVNVGLSRAREHIVLIASRAEGDAAGAQPRSGAAPRLRDGRQASPGPGRGRQRQDRRAGPLAEEDARSGRGEAFREDLGRVRQPIPQTSPPRDDRGGLAGGQGRPAVPVASRRIVARPRGARPAAPRGRQEHGAVPVRRRPGRPSLPGREERPGDRAPLPCPLRRRGARPRAEYAQAHHGPRRARRFGAAEQPVRQHLPRQRPERPRPEHAEMVGDGPRHAGPKHRHEGELSGHQAHRRVRPFKGYDAEIVVIPSVESFQSQGKPLTQALYVAMTRARSLLAIHGKASKKGSDREIVEAIEACLDTLEARPAVEVPASKSDEFEDLLLSIGLEHKDWLKSLKGTYRLVQEPLLASDRGILCEPLFWYESGARRFACFPEGKPSQRVKDNLEDADVTILAPGQPRVI